MKKEEIRIRQFKYMYIDESGDLGLNGSNYMTIAALLVTEPKELDRIIKSLRRNKFRKELKKAIEIKANKSSAQLITEMILRLNQVKGAKLFFIVLEKQKVTSEYFKSNKHKLYDYVAGRLAKNIILEGGCVEVRIDLSKGKHILREDFNKCFLRNLHKNSKPTAVSIFHSLSHCWAGLQFADVLAWSCFQKFEHSNPVFIDLIILEKEIYFVWQKNCST